MRVRLRRYRDFTMSLYPLSQMIESAFNLKVFYFIDIINDEEKEIANAEGTAANMVGETREEEGERQLYSFV